MTKGKIIIESGRREDEDSKRERDREQKSGSEA